jgi:hypothetical protein
MHKGALVTRDAYQALLDLKSLVETAVEKAHMAGLETAGLGVSSRPPVGDPLKELRSAAETLHSPTFETTLAEARSKIDQAMAWHQEAHPLAKSASGN